MSGTDLFRGLRVHWRVALGGLVLLALWYVPLCMVPLQEPDEGRYAEIPREMLATGDFVMPHLNGTLYLDKPPLYYWLTAAAMRALGRNEFSCRFWSATLGLATILAVVILGTDLRDRRTGALAGIILASSPLFAFPAHLNTIDLTVSFFITLTLACFWFAHAAAPGTPRWRCWYGVFLGAALAVLTKGLIGVVIPGAVIVLFIALSGRWRSLRSVPWVGGTILFLVVALPWHVLAARRSPDFLSYYFIKHHFMRYATPVARRTQPFWYLVAVFLAGCLPWTGLIPTLFRRPAGRGWREVVRERPHLLFLACWVTFVVGFFSLSSSKIASYVLPATPALALLIALALAGLLSGTSTLSRVEAAGGAVAALLTAVLAAAVTVAGAGLLPELRHLSGHSVATTALGLAGVAFSVLAGVAWWRRAAARGTLLSGAAAACLVAGLWAVLVQFGPSRSTRDLAAFLRPRLTTSDVVFSYGNYQQTLPFYLGREIGVVNYNRDLEFGISHSSDELRSRRFPTETELHEILRSRQRVFVVAEPREAKKLLASSPVDLTIEAEYPQLVLLSNRSPAAGVAGLGGGMLENEVSGHGSHGQRDWVDLIDDAEQRRERGTDQFVAAQRGVPAQDLLERRGDGDVEPVRALSPAPVVAALGVLRP